MLRKILIVDDDQINRRILGRILRDEYQVLEAANGQEALTILSASHEDVSVVLLDLVMPIMDGYDTLSHIQEEPAFAQIPVIITTSASSEDAEVKALSMGANDFITKPYSPAIIKHRIRNTIKLRETSAIINALQKDDLTGLPNRRAFFDKAAELIAGQEPGYYVMACFDVDNFKVINDQYGNAKGDQVLQQLAEVFRTGFQPIGGVCGRISADVFAVLYPCNYMDSPQLEQIRANAAKLDGSIRPISFSIGRYIVNDLSLSVSAMYDRAAIAKTSVKARFDGHIAQYDESMRQSILRDQEIIDEMKGALESGQFEPWLQPQYNHSSGALIGAEVLARWRHPAKGIIYPGEFIPIFERNGFVYELDKNIWEQTCALLRRWLDQGRPPLPLSVNVSRYDVFQDDFFPFITGLVEKYAIPLDLLRLEITESAFARSARQIISAVKSLVDYGFIIEIDDFGSGYSSLNTLKDVPADILKLDMRFLENDENSSRGGNILESVVRMAKWLGMPVIAEGVETRSQADYLRSIGCFYVQGYLYARPMTVEEFERLADNLGKERMMKALETVESLDNNAFWDPKSMDTLIFNSYVGGACIFEYHEGKTELLRVNEKYAIELSGGELPMEAVMGLEVVDYMDEENRERMMANILTAIETGRESSCEIVMNGLTSRPGPTYLRVAVRVLAQMSGRKLLYASVINTTAQREAERKEVEVSQQLQAIMDNVPGGVSAATINNRRVNYIFVNDWYYTMYGYTKEQFHAAAPRGIVDIIHPEDVDRVIDTALAAEETNASFQIEYRVYKQDGSLIWVRSNGSVCRIAGYASPVQLAVSNDITAEKEAAQQIFQSAEQLKFLNETAHDLLAQADAEAGIQGVLAKVMDYFAGERAYVMEIDSVRQVVNNTYEVCAPQVTSELPNLQNIPISAIPFWLHAFEQTDAVCIDDVDSLGDDRLEERRILSEQGIRSLVAVPLRRDGALLGFIGVDDPARHGSHIQQLRAIGDYITVMLARRDLNAKIESDRQAILSLMNDTPGGFVRIRVFPDDSGSAPVYANQGFCDMVGMSQEEILDFYAESSFAGVHPEDVETVRTAEEEMLRNGQARSGAYRLLRQDGGYVWVKFFGRVVRGENGEVFFNIYYTDLTEQERKDISLRQTLPLLLAAVIESSTDLSFVKDKDLNYICCSGAFARMVGLNGQNDVQGKTDYDLFTPEIADKYRQDDLRLMESGVSIVDMVELIPSDDGVPHYSSTSKHLLKDQEGNIIGLYGTGRDITENRDSSAKLRLLADSMPGGLATYACTKDYIKIIYTNDAYSALFGREREECERLFAEDPTALVFAEDLPTLMGQFSRMLETGAPIACEYRIHTKDGGFRWIAHRGEVAERQGELVIGNAALYDITNHKLAEEAERKNQENMRLRNQLIDESSSSVYVCDTENYQMLYVNENAARMCGKTVAESQGLTCYKYLKNVDVPCEPCYIHGSTENAYTEREYHSPVSGKHYLTRGRIIDWGGRRALVMYMTDETERILARRNMQDLIEGIPSGMGIFALYPDGRLEIRYLNSGYYELIGVGQEQRQAYMGFGMLEAVHEEDRENIRRGLDVAIQENRVSAVDVRIKISGDEYKWLSARAKVAYQTNKHTVFYISFSDIDREKKALLKNVFLQQEIRLRYEHERQLRHQIIKDAIIYYEINLTTGRIEEYNSRIDGPISLGPEGKPDSSTDESILKNIAAEDREAFRNAFFIPGLQAAYDQGETSVEMVYRRRFPNGSMKWVKAIATIMKKPGCDEVVAFLYCQDIDAETRATMNAQKQAEQDGMTQLYNKVTTESLIRERLSRGGPCVLMIIDLDNLKTINDTYGHAVGDEAIRYLSSILKSRFRHSDIVGRVGGDEFAVFVDGDLSDKKLETTLSSFLRSLSNHYLDENKDIALAASIGVARGDGGRDSYEDLFEKADKALYYVKRNGKNHFALYKTEMEEAFLT